MVAHFRLRGGNYHYHHTLEAGENTLEAQMVRLFLRSITSTGGCFDGRSTRMLACKG